MSRYPDELEADLQEFFGIDIESMGCAHSVPHVAVCASNLPRSSRVSRMLDPAAAWSETDYLTAIAADRLGLIICALGGKKAKFEPIERPADRARRPDPGACAMEVAELDRYLSKPRKEAGHGN